MNTYLSRRLWMHANDVDFYVMTVFSNTFWASDLRERAKKKHRMEVISPKADHDHEKRR